MSSATASESTRIAPSARSGQPPAMLEAMKPSVVNAAIDTPMSSPAICWPARLVFTSAATMSTQLPAVSR